MPPRYLKLATLYFLYFASFGIYMPYWAPYLRSLGFDVIQIGELLTVFLGTRVLSPYLWSWISDRIGQRLKMFRLAAVLSVVFFAVMMMHDGNYVWLIIGIFFFAFFFNAWLPQLESITLDSLGHMSDSYSKIRLWGSIGFIIATMGSVPLIDRYGFSVIPYLMFFAISLTWLVSLFCDDRRQRGIGAYCPYRIGAVLARPEILALSGMCLIVQLSHSPYYAFFSIYLSDFGYSKIMIGSLWSLGVIAEICVFLLAPRLLSRWTEPTLLTFSMVITALRWFLTAQFPQELPILIFTQTLHSISFGVHHAAAIKLINCWFPGNLQARGQAIYIGVSFGAGAGIGMLASGYLWDRFGGSTVFLIAGYAALAGTLLSIPLYRGYRESQLLRR